MLEEFRLKEHPTVELYKIPNFLTEVECSHLIGLIDKNLQPSTVTGGAGEYAVTSDFRTSSTSVLPVGDPTVAVIDNKIRHRLGISDFGEGIQGQKYEVGQHFKDHTDFFQAETLKQHCTDRGQGNRSWTFMIYLNTVPAGGATGFSKLGIEFKAERGTAVIWKNSDIDGTVYPDTMHSGNPVVEGTKYIITKWFKHPLIQTSIPVNPEIVGEFSTRYNLPKFTAKGFAVMDVPEKLWGIINDTYKIIAHTIEPEPETHVIRSAATKVASDIMRMDICPSIRAHIHEQLLPIHEAWSNQKLETSYCYGIRSYNKGAILDTHVDRIKTHHISCIILVDEDSNTPWPLHIMNNAGVWEEVIIKPGQMILYESATCEHGRVKPFDGNFFRNFFVHYKLVDYKYVGE